MQIKEVQNELFNILNDVVNLCNENGIEYWLEAGTLLGAVRHKGFIPWDDDIDIGMDRENYRKFLRIANKKLDDKYFIQTPYSDNEYLTPHVPCKIRNTTTCIIEDDYDEQINQKGLYIDIFPFDYESENKIEKAFNYMCKMMISAKMLSNAKIKNTYINKKIIVNNSVKLLMRIFKLYPNCLNRYFCKHIKLNKKSEYITYGYDTCYFKKFKYEDIYPLSKIEFNGKIYKVPNNYNEYLKNLYGDYMIIPPKKERKNHISYFKYKVDS